jgi:hypothetical protein
MVVVQKLRIAIGDSHGVRYGTLLTWQLLVGFIQSVVEKPSKTYMCQYMHPWCFLEFKSLWSQVLRHIKFTREMLKDQLHLCKIQTLCKKL